jgi:hypothetical protein
VGLDILALIGTFFFVLATIFYCLTVFSDPGFVTKKFSLIVHITINLNYYLGDPW